MKKYAEGNRQDIIEKINGLTSETDAAIKAKTKAIQLIEKGFSKTNIPGIVDLWWVKTQLGSYASHVPEEEAKDIFIRSMQIMEQKCKKTQI